MVVSYTTAILRVKKKAFSEEKASTAIPKPHDEFFVRVVQMWD